MKKQKYIWILLAWLLMLAGCHRAASAWEVTLDIENTAYRVAEAAEFGITYNAASDFLMKTYGFDENSAASYQVLLGTMLDANRLALFEVADQDTRESVMAVAEKMKEEVQKNFGEDQPDLKAQAENARILEKGRYILFLSGKNGEAGEAEFLEIFSEQLNAIRK